MTCPSCHSSNPDDALRCVKCGAAFVGRSTGQTVAGESASAPQGSPVIPKPSSAAAVATPTPGSVSNAPTLDGSAQVSRGFSVALQPGSQFGSRYRIESLLGQGGMGTVYKAYDKELDRIVALKLVRPELTADPSTMQRFKQELLLASKISHKNVLRIHDLGEVGGMKFISMAYVEGEDLQHVLKKGRPPLERALNIARQLTAALEAAHAEGVVHRDLKPQNVLVDRAGTAYVSDFGLAKSLEAEAAGMTRTGQVLGTPYYMSPEQVEAKPADHRSDLYSLGLIFYEMVTGAVPFPGDSALQVMYQRLKEKPQNPKQLNPELPDYLARLIMRCLEKDPARRYQSAREILQDLEAERAPSFSRSVQITLPALPKRGWLLAVGGLLALVILVLAIRPLRRFIFRTAPANAPMSEPRPTPGEQKYLAVLPFRVAGDQASLNYVAVGLVEALSAKLFQLRDVHVASTTAVEKASKNVSLEKTARELGVNLLIQGTLQGSGEKMRIVVNLEDVAAGRRLWSQEFSGVSQDLLTLEDQIYAQLVAALKLRPSQDELARSSSHPTENIEAYDLYLKGRNAMRGEQDVKNIETAIRFYEDALKQDSGFALAYAGIADASLLMYREKKDSFWSQKALAAAQQAERLNDSLAEVHSSLGSVYRATGKTAQAAAELKHALELAPNSDEGYRRLGDNYWASGRKDEAIQAYQKAVQINPYYWVNYNELGNAYLNLEKFGEALAAYRRMTELEPANAFGYVNIGAVYFSQGKYEECIPAFEKALALQPLSATYSNLGTAYFFLKRYNESVKMFEKAVEMNPNDQDVMGNLADAYRWAGQPEKALATYDKAIALAYKDLQVNPRHASTMASLALYYAKKGDAARAASFIHRARSIDHNDVALIFNEAEIQALTGHPDQALKALREAFQKGLPPKQAENDPELKTVQARPEFQRLVKEFSGKAD